MLDVAQSALHDDKGSIAFVSVVMQHCFQIVEAEFESVLKCNSPIMQ